MSDFSDTLTLAEMADARRKARRPRQSPRIAVAAPPQLPAVADSYADLIRVFAGRRRALRISQLALDDLAGTQGGYVGKIEAGIKNLGPVSLPSIAGALRLKLLIEPAPDALPGEILRRFPMLSPAAITITPEAAID